MTSQYQKAEAYINSIPKFTKKHSLEHTREFIRRLGNPGKDRKIIHVAGTNGKGSVCAYMQAILAREGKSCGFFTSPHLVKINERIQINRSQISDEAFTDIFDFVLSKVKQMQAEGIEHPSYFEFLYGMGMVAFERADVEYIILETGLGGRLDATNANPKPAMTVITSISLDHTDILGNSIAQIAGEKAGIIKEGVPLVFDANDQTAREVIEKKAAEKQAATRMLCKEDFEILSISSEYIAFLRKNAYDKDTVWKVPFSGIYQVMNAGLAITAMEELLGKEAQKKQEWPTAVEEVRWEGRMERVAEHFTVDGAHNPGAILAFAESILALGERISVLLFSAVSDKKYEQMIKLLCEKLPADTYVVTEIEDKRKVPANELAALFQNYTRQPVICCPSIKDAILKAYELRGEGEIYCLGSLYLVGAVKQEFARGVKND